MKRSLIALSICLSLTLTACGGTAPDAGELPAIVFLFRTDYSQEMSPEDLEKYNLSEGTLSLIDREGNCYYTDDPEINAMNNQTLAAEYETGNLTASMTLYKTVDADELAEQYAKLLNIYRKGNFEIVYPDAVPAVQASYSWWSGFYFDKDGSLQTQIIHEKHTTDFYTDNRKVNAVYDWITGKQ